jgi:MFS family permease
MFELVRIAMSTSRSVFFAALFFTMSWFVLAFTREPTDNAKAIEENPTPFWQGASRILKRDTNFNWFLIARTLSQFATMGFAFYIVYALRHFQMDEITAGFLTATLTISQTVANAGMGWLAIRSVTAPCSSSEPPPQLFSSLLAWVAPSLAWFYPIFILTGFANVSIWTNGMTMTVDFSGEADRPFYIGLAQTLTAPATMLAPLIGGWIADTQGFGLTFALSTILSIVMLAILVFIIKEPRKFVKAQDTVIPRDNPIRRNHDILFRKKQIKPLKS